MAYWGRPQKYRDFRQFIYALDKGRCHICRRRVGLKDSVLDHIIPLGAWGLWGILSSDEYWNVRIAHRGCNSRRGRARVPGQLRLPIPVDYAKWDMPRRRV